jgi:hypothetical protein
MSRAKYDVHGPQRMEGRAQGSFTELKNFLLIAKDVGYLNKTGFDGLAEQANLSHKLLQGLLQKTKSFLRS